LIKNIKGGYDMIEYKKRYCIEFEINQIALNDTERQEKIYQIHKDYYMATDTFINNIYHEYKMYEVEDKLIRGEK
jgi:hypothetical protein